MFLNINKIVLSCVMCGSLLVPSFLNSSVVFASDTDSVDKTISISSKSLESSKIIIGEKNKDDFQNVKIPGEDTEFEFQVKFQDKAFAFGMRGIYEGEGIQLLKEFNFIDFVKITNSSVILVSTKGVEYKLFDLEKPYKASNMRAVTLSSSPTLSQYHDSEGNLILTTNNLFDQGIFVVPIEENLPFKDVKKSDWHYDYVKDIYNLSIANGTSEDSFSPNKSITRAQFSVMLARALELDTDRYYAYTGDFKDLGGKWYSSEVMALNKIGVIGGYEDGTFRGDTILTRQQASVMLVRALEYLEPGLTKTNSNILSFKDSDKISAYAKSSVNFLADNDVIVSGKDLSFNPTANLTRAQMAKMLMKSLKLSDRY